MRILIFSFQRAHNFGAILQSIALRAALAHEGYSNIVFANYSQKYIDELYSPFVTAYKLSTKKTILSKLRIFIGAILLLPISIPKYFIMKQFIGKHIPLFPKRKCSFSKLAGLVRPDDVLIAGSDQIWNSNVTIGYDEAMFLRFDTKKRIFYAASIGEKETFEKNQSLVRSYIADAKYLSVREVETMEILKAWGFSNTKNVLDPTFLLDEKEWSKNTKKSREGKYIFVYSFGMTEEVAKYIESVAELEGLRIIEIGQEQKRRIRGKRILFADPFDFLTLIKNAEYIITNSFHATVFSVIFRKQFMCYSSGKTNVRIENLLNAFRLGDRMLNKKNNIIEKIDYQRVGVTLEILRQESMKFLSGALKEMAGND
jgi:hypothetical protein